MAVDASLRALLRAIAQSDPGSQPYGLLLQGRGREAREAARASVELQPGVPIHSLRLVVVELDQGRVRQARRAVERVIRPAPDDPATAEAMALVLLAEHRWLEAEATIGRVFRSKPEDEQAVWILALALEGQGRRDAAIEAFAWLRSRGRHVPTDIARQSVWRAWRWHELAGLGLMATILAHLAIEAFRTPYGAFRGATRGDLFRLASRDRRPAGRAYLLRAAASPRAHRRGALPGGRRRTLPGHERTHCLWARALRPRIPQLCRRRV
jgi:tetratricopeptide (TPR) repeat protein